MDVAASKDLDSLPIDYTITEADLEGCTRQEGVVPQEGDAVLVRTGSGRFWRDPPRYLQRSGLDKDSVKWLAGKSISLLGCDMSSPDSLTYADPDTGDSRFAHIILLAKGGVHIIENMFLEELSRARCYRFIFIGLPIKMVGATGAPIRPIAIA